MIRYVYELASQFHSYYRGHYVITDDAALTQARLALLGALRTTIANNSAWMSAVNVYLANGGYAQQTNGEQNWKQIKVKGYRGIIEYSESSGYKLSVPIGQSSLIVWDGVNFASEQEMITAANAFDLDGIKKTLGEK